MQEPEGLIMLAKLFLAMVLGVALSMCQGCMTLFVNRTVDVSVTSMPSGLTVKTADGQTITTPGRVKLNRDDEHVLQFFQDGQAVKSVTISSKHSAGRWEGSILLNACHGIFTLGISAIIGVGIDVSNGAMKYLLPETVHVDMNAASPTAEASPSEEPRRRVRSPGG